MGEILKKLGIEILNMKSSGEFINPGDAIMSLRGNAKKILSKERVLLNLLIYLFGVATTTKLFVDKVREVNKKVRIAATRKTIPGLRLLTKKAVKIGGGDTHRLSLSDAILIKDNHIKVIGDVVKAVELAKKYRSFIHKVEVEVSSVEEAVKAASLGVDVIMLDNFTPNDVRRVINELYKCGIRENVIIEVSGGITLENINEYAAMDIDVISSSVITMNPVKVDLSLEVERC